MIFNLLIGGLLPKAIIFNLLIGGLLTQVLGDCSTYTTTQVTSYETSYFVVNPIPARDTFDNTLDNTVYLCKNYFDTINEFSCLNTTIIPETESCCFENWGILLLTQFYDYNTTYLEIAVNGTEIEKNEIEKKESEQDNLNTFTIHGLWNDLCDGSYQSYCNPELEINNQRDNITNVIVNEFNKPELYEYMVNNWVNNLKSNVENAGSIDLWEHEYNKHGTCMNTLDTKCFEGEYKRFENTVAYWEKTVELHKQLPTEKFLQQQGIVPSVTKQYKLSDIESALAKNHDGRAVYVGCQKGAIAEIWYYHNLKGGVVTGDYKPSDLIGKKGCPENVWYIPK